MSEGDAGYPEQPPSWSPDQPPASGDAYGSPPGTRPGYQPPPPPLPPTPVPGYAQPAYPYASSYPPPGYGGPAAPKPGIIPLRPLVFSEILDGAVQAIRSNPRMLLWTGIAVVGIAIVLGGTFAGGLWLTSTSTTDSGGLLLADLISSLGQIGFQLLAIAAQTMLAGLIIFSVSQSVLGHQATFSETWQRVRPSFWRLLGFTLLSSLAVFVGYLCCILPGIALGAWFALGAPALVLEGAGVRAAFGRSTTLVKGGFWRVLGILFVSGLISNIVAVMVTAVLAGIGALAGLVFGSTGAIIGAAVLGGIGFIVALTVVSTFSAAVSSLLYIDMRMRREGLDIALARAADAAPA